MKSVLISIKPKYCELIASGKKIIEVRKTRPKLDLPFKCYIYCTKNGAFMVQSKTNPSLKTNRIKKYGGKVIGEFVCDSTEEYDMVFDEYGVYDISDDEMQKICLSNDNLWEYAIGKTLYGWHISDLKMYGKPKELSEFYFPPEIYCEKELCGGCPYDAAQDVNGEYDYDCEWKRPLKRPPQSWCYVEELGA